MSNTKTAFIAVILLAVSMLGIVACEDDRRDEPTAPAGESRDDRRRRNCFFADTPEKRDHYQCDKYERDLERDRN